MRFKHYILIDEGKITTIKGMPIFDRADTMSSNHWYRLEDDDRNGVKGVPSELYAAKFLYNAKEDRCFIWSGYSYIHATMAQMIAEAFPESKFNFFDTGYLKMAKFAGVSKKEYRVQFEAPAVKRPASSVWTYTTGTPSNAIQQKVIRALFSSSSVSGDLKRTDDRTIETPNLRAYYSTLGK